MCSCPMQEARSMSGIRGMFPEAAAGGGAPRPERSPGSLRGQAWATDMLAGLAALTFIMVLFTFMWSTLTLRWDLASRHTDMASSAFFASESLLATPGEPEGWEMLPHIDGRVKALGLVSGRNELNRAKLDKFVSENATAYGTIKTRLGMQRYEFGMRITDLGGNKVHYEFGKFSGGALNSSLNFDRFGILDGKPVLVHMEVWGG